MGGNEISVRASRIVAAVAVVTLLSVLVVPGRALGTPLVAPRVALLAQPNSGDTILNSLTKRALYNIVSACLESHALFSPVYLTM